MQNNRTIEEQANAAARMVVNFLSAITPLFLILSILGIAGFTGYMEYTFYRDIIGGFAFIPGVLYALIRFGAGLGGIRLFKLRHFIQGVFFVLVSVALTIWTSYHVGTIAGIIATDPGKVDSARYLLTTMLWTALIGEVMIAVIMSVHKDETRNETDGVTGSVTAPKRNTTAMNWRERNGKASSNGNGIVNETKRNPIGFKKPVNGPNARSNGISDRNEEALQLGLKRARNNLRQYRNRLRNGEGNPATQQRNITKWEAKVQEYETLLSE